MNKLYKKASTIIKNSDALLIGAGAGIGVDSGLPDFRGVQGFWNSYPIMKELNLDFSSIANPKHFKIDPKLAWAFYGHRYNMYKETNPHKGFDILLEIANKMKYGYFVYTSNVDGHFQKAGFKTENIYEIHGSINLLQCQEPCSDDIWEPDFETIHIDENKFEATGEMPKCKHCGTIARPNILMFGDWNWISKRSDNQRNNYANWIHKLKSNNAKIVIIELGAGTAIPSVRYNSHSICDTLGAKLIRINPRDFDCTDGQIGISAGGLEALTEIYNQYS